MANQHFFLVSVIGYKIEDFSLDAWNDAARLLVSARDLNREPYVQEKFPLETAEKSARWAFSGFSVQLRSNSRRNVGHCGYLCLRGPHRSENAAQVDANLDKLRKQSEQKEKNGLLGFATTRCFLAVCAGSGKFQQIWYSARKAGAQRATTQAVTRP